MTRSSSREEVVVAPAQFSRRDINQSATPGNLARPTRSNNAGLPAWAPESSAFAVETNASLFATFSDTLGHVRFGAFASAASFSAILAHRTSHLIVTFFGSLSNELGSPQSPITGFRVEIKPSYRLTYTFISSAYKFIGRAYKAPRKFIGTSINNL